jgi:cbb3-type cytochrome oxidase subunit 3
MQTNPLDGLHDIIAPSQVSIWPLAPAWWVIIALLCVLVAASAYWLYKRYQFNKAKRYAIQLSQQHESAQQLHIILKRLVIAYYDKRLAAQATAAWCTTLTTLTGITFSEQEILSIYNQTAPDTALCHKFRQGIKQFKLKEVVHV